MWIRLFSKSKVFVSIRKRFLEIEKHIWDIIYETKAYKCFLRFMEDYELTIHACTLLVILSTSIYAFEAPQCIFFFYIIFFLTTILGYIYINHISTRGYYSVVLITILMLLISLIINFNEFFLKDLQCELHLFKFGKLCSFYDVEYMLILDKTSYSFVLLTTFISFFVFLYTYVYFKNDAGKAKFFFFLCNFIWSMLFLLMSSNFVTLLLGWELIGMTSFLLINFWSTKLYTLKASMKAFTFNRISDFCLLIFICISLNHTSSLDLIDFNNNFSNLFFKNSELGLFNISTISLVLILVACFIKSAQFGFHLWLPDSMEAPVPASALIHSATLVSAGIYLSLRVLPAIKILPEIDLLVGLFGALTFFVGSFFATRQVDCKKILAYSTISNCGLLFLMIYYNLGDLVLMYLIIHGVFKAMAFMCLGNVIALNKNCQDIQQMGGFYKYLPIECLVLGISLLFLSGFPLTISYVLKHQVLTNPYNTTVLHMFMQSLIIYGTFCSILYSFKLHYYIFFGKRNANINRYRSINRKDLFKKVHTNNSKISNYIIIVYLLASILLILCLFSTVGWVYPIKINQELMLDGVSYVNNSTYTNYQNFTFLKFIFLNVVTSSLVIMLLYNTNTNYINYLYKIIIIILILYII
jgi:NADH-quinone oxidoreductase subunit L